MSLGHICLAASTLCTETGVIETDRERRDVKRESESGRDVERESDSGRDAERERDISN